MSCAGGTPGTSVFSVTAVTDQNERRSRKVRKSFETDSSEFTWKCLLLYLAQVTALLQCLNKSVPHRLVIRSSISFFRLFFLFLLSHQRRIRNRYYYSNDICFRIFL